MIFTGRLSLVRSFYAFALVSLFYSYQFAQPDLQRDSLADEYQNHDDAGYVFADSLTYQWLYRNDTLGAMILRGQARDLGPVIFTKLTLGNPWLALCLLLSFLWVVITRIASEGSSPTTRLSLLLFFNPVMFYVFSLPTKEVFVYLALISLCVFALRGSKLFLACSLFLGAFSRPETVVLLLGAIFVTALDKKIRLVWIVCIFLLFAVLYSFDLPIGKLGKEIVAESGVPGGMSQSLDVVADYPLGLVIAAPIRLLHTMLEGVISLFTSFNGSFLQCSHAISGMLFLYLTVILIFRFRRADDRSQKLASIAILYFIMISLMCYPHHRYLVPIYPVLALFAVRTSSRSCEGAEECYNEFSLGLQVRVPACNPIRQSVF